MDPSETVAMLNSYFSELTPIILEYGGTVGKYIGDSILAVFGSPERDGNQHEKAVRAALEMQRKIGEINQDRTNRMQVTCRLVLASIAERCCTASSAPRTEWGSR